MMQQQKQHLHPILGLWPWILLTLGLTVLPYGWVAHSTPEGQKFLGSLINTGDLSVYLAAIRQGAEGAWLFEVTFTPEPITPKITYPFYLALGRLAKVFAVDVLLLFHGSRVLVGGILLLFVPVWLNFLGLAKQVIKDAFFFIFLAGGLGWLFLGTGWLLPDLHMAEWLPFLSMFHAPHFTLGIAAEMVVLSGLLAAYRQRPWSTGGTAALASLGALALSLLYPYRIVPLGATIALYCLSEIGRDWWNWRATSQLLLTSFWSLLILGGFSLYYGLIARADPYWEATHVVQNSIPSPNPLEAILAWGIMGVLAFWVGYAALAKGRQGWQKLPEGIRLCFVWFVAGVVCLYLPVSFQGRFALNIYLPLAIIGAWGLHQLLLPYLAERLEEGAKEERLARYRRLILLVGFMAIEISLWLFIQRSQALPEQYFIAQSEAQAAEWVAEYGRPDDLVLIGPRMGNYLPRYFVGRVFTGQFYITVNSQEKVELVHQFFEPDTTDAWRRAFLDEWQIDLIYYGYDEAQLGPPTQLPNWTIVYDQDGVIIYQRP